MTVQPFHTADRPARVTQATSVEQSRAEAEVKAAVAVALQFPRNVAAASAEMVESCKTTFLAERAFYAVPNRGAGPSVHLARELARIFGNIQYGVKELSRDDEAGMSEIQAFAWDLQTNTRSERTFQVPHARMKGRDRQRLTDLGDVYSNNQTQGARAVRECIFSILPPWFVEQAKDACNATLKHGGGKPLAQRISDAVKAFEGVGVDADRIAAKLGKPSGKWTEHDVAQLIVAFRSIDRGEVSAEELFPQERVSVDDVLGAPKAARKAKDEPADGYDPTTQPGSGSDAA